MKHWSSAWAKTVRPTGSFGFTGWAFFGFVPWVAVGFAASGRLRFRNPPPLDTEVVDALGAGDAWDEAGEVVSITGPSAGRVGVDPQPKSRTSQRVDNIRLTRRAYTRWSA